MNHDDYPDEYIRGILRATRTIAMVGASSNWNRPSFFAMKYLQEKGYRVLPVNPREAATGAEILGEKVYASLLDMPHPVDMVDCFRASEAIPPIAVEAVKIGAKVLWLQLGVVNREAARLAEAAGMQVVMNRCPKIEIARLTRELGWLGVNTGIISARRRRSL